MLWNLESQYLTGILFKAVILCPMTSYFRPPTNKVVDNLTFRVGLYFNLLRLLSRSECLPFYSPCYTFCEIILSFCDIEVWLYFLYFFVFYYVFYLAYSTVSRGNLVLRYSFLHFSLKFSRHCVLSDETQRRAYCLDARAK